MNTAAIDADLLRRYRYLFDLGGNRTQEIATVGAATTTTDYEYTAANQIYRRRVNAGAWTTFSYDNNGNLTNDGTNTYTWDRANRLKQRGLNYTYDGYGNRFQGDVTKYLLDIQPGLSEVIREEDTGSHGGFYGPPYFVHGLRGLHAFNRVNSSSGTRYWTWSLEDGLGSVRLNVDSAGSVLESRNYDPYGNSFNPTGTSQTDYGFTGEPTDSNGLLYLRARYYSPTTGVFTAIDPFEGKSCDPMSLNGYGYVAGNPNNKVDPSGMIYENPYSWDSCGIGNFMFVGFDDPVRRLVEIAQDLRERVCKGAGPCGPYKEFYRDNMSSQDCFDRFDRICQILCGGEWLDRHLISHDHKGLFDRYIEYGIDKDDMEHNDPEGRANHEAKYDETQSWLTNQRAEWNSRNCSSSDEDIAEFMPIAEDWEDNALPGADSFSIQICIGNFCFHPPVLIPPIFVPL